MDNLADSARAVQDSWRELREAQEAAEVEQRKRLEEVWRHLREAGAHLQEADKHGINDRELIACLAQLTHAVVLLAGGPLAAEGSGESKESGGRDG